MGSLIQGFTFGRNALKRSISESAAVAFKAIDSTASGVNLVQLKSTDNGAYNVYRDFISFLGILSRQESTATATPVGDVYRRLYEQNSEDAWRWLITRSLWLYVVPNGTDSHINDRAEKIGARFNFFRLLLGLLCLLAGLPTGERFLRYSELCELLDDDSNWVISSADLFVRLLQMRASAENNQVARGLLGDLEAQYGIPRDNFNTVLNKAFQQTGLFDYTQVGGKITGIALGARLDTVLSSRVRFILDNSADWDGSNWPTHLQLKSTDLPQEVSLVRPSEIEEEEPSEDIGAIIAEAADQFNAAGLRVNSILVRRFAAALLAKPFVILTGLSGSGKTKLAHAFASWISPRYQFDDPFVVGASIETGTASYEIVAADSISVEVRGAGGPLVVVPRSLIAEWVSCIQANAVDNSRDADAIQKLVEPDSQYGNQFQAYSSELKALAFAQLARVQTSNPARHFEIVPVNADWTNKESTLGYPDALNEGRYVRTTAALDLIIKAKNDPLVPYFLILDEMNLSHVERYFADFLSALESGEKISLHGGVGEMDGVPPSIDIPKNLFIIGTVNVDETTYTFSPKVLDRANAIEFRVDEVDIGSYLENPRGIDLKWLSGRGQKFAKSFVLAATHADARSTKHARLSAEMRLLFSLLSAHGREYGFRVAYEIVRFSYYYEMLSPEGASFGEIIDAQICQKILPRLNGSRRQLEPILCALAVFCHRPRVWDDTSDVIKNESDLLQLARKAADLVDDSLHAGMEGSLFEEPAAYPLSFTKVRKMLVQAMAEGFASFAEA
ncbi:McrB family protein [Paraburkholderia nodosa]|uniref:McrB family protein n=1 Tax=Paraburkholderia nodosa TaxID=392320 RepID=UPI0004BC08CC|nr:hypothetical protein [Paraburkholderia nodosa]